MTDNSLGEALSAALDGEASEFELRRVVRGLDDAALCEQAFRYQLQGELLREEHTAFAGIDLSGRIRARIEAEDLDVLQDGADVSAAVAGSDIRFWQRPLARAAVAASVTLAVILGVNTYNRADLGQPALVADAGIRTQVAPTSPIGAQSLLAGLDVQGTSPASVADQDRLAQSHWRQAQRVESYMRQHTAQTVLTSAQGALPFARVASFDAR